MVTNVIDGALVRGVLRASGSPHTEATLRSLGLEPTRDPARRTPEPVPAEAFFEVIERTIDPDDTGLPFRYARSSASR